MKNLIYFEWKKIWERKFHLIAMASGYLIIIVTVIAIIKTASFYDVTTEKYVYGKRAFELSMAKTEQAADYLTEEYLTKLVQEIKGLDIPLDSQEGYTQIIRPQNDILRVICDNYMEVGEHIEWNMLYEIPIENGIQFYNRRIEKVESYLNQDFSYGNYTAQEKAFWMEKLQQVETPFSWGDKSLIDTYWNAIQIGFYLLFVIVICISPVFASEYESGAASLLFTTKYGKNRMIYAKIICAVLFSVLYCIIGVGIGLFISWVVLGCYGQELPIQLWSSLIPYDWNAGVTCIITMLVLLLVAVSMTLLTLCLSSRIKGSIASLVVMFTLLMGPAFLPMSQTSGLWNHINYLFPIRAVMIKDVLRTFNSYQVGDWVISYLGMIVLVYGIIGIGSFWAIKKEKVTPFLV